MIDNEDFRDILTALADVEADFVVVGGYAVAFHGHPRATRDIDIFVRPSTSNSKRVFRALAAFGAPIAAFEVGESDFSRYTGVLQLGLPPNRIDIITSIDGVTFDEAVRAGDATSVSGRRIPLIGREALLANKRAAGRPKGLVDIEALEALIGSETP